MTLRTAIRLTLAASIALIGLGLRPAAAVERVTIRALSPSAIDLDDWTKDRQISPALVATGGIEVQYCEEHFPTGSQALLNLQAAVGAYNAVPGVAINMATVLAPGTAVHPADPRTFGPADAIYVDYAYDMDPGAWAGAWVINSSCSANGGIDACSEGLLILNGNNYVTDTDPTDSDNAPSVGVFVHELGHLFGLEHIEPSAAVLQNPTNLHFARATIHGHKFHHDDLRGAPIHALTLRFLREYYLGSIGFLLDTDELTVHPNMVVADPTTGVLEEFSADKDYQRPTAGTALTDGINEVKLRWNPRLHVGGAFEACAAPGVDPTWYAQFSETSTNTTKKLFGAEFLVSTTPVAMLPQDWTVVASVSGLTSHAAGAADFRQFEWEKSFPITWRDVNTPAGGPLGLVVRRLKFRVDSAGQIRERNEANNEWQVKLCLFPGPVAGVPNACSASCNP